MASTSQTLFNALRQPAGLALQEMRGDHLSVNTVQNILVLSSPDPDRAEKYPHITSITLGGAVFSSRGYIACPENTVKGVIHGIPPDYSAANIHDEVVQPCNPTALHARRIGQTNKVLVSFSGSRVPHYINIKSSVAATQNMVATLNTHLAKVLPKDAPVRTKTAVPGPTRHTPYTRIPVTSLVNVSVKNGDSSSAVSSSPATPLPSKPV
ncbi:hypothetical protein HPB48_016937 [Haemaphysalis longicornis]|uniref:Uncharacterized protein n=1 Tax=Haemaphysalis longicornis TaxID=44386 RepID=A0A9J6FSQ3_HAELO|nr:hypothetical protein HPB48_016937 [Haemaphysalis longicornis]